MHLFSSLENRFAVVIQDETLLHRAIVAFIPAIFTMINTLIWGIVFHLNGLTTLGFIYFAYVVGGSIALLAVTYRPSLAALAMGVIATAGVLANTAAHLAVGGFDSGVWFLVWLIIIPLSLYLSGFPRQGLPSYGVALLALTVAFVAEPRLGAPPPIPDWLRLVYNGLALFTSVTMTLVWSVYILQQLDAARRQADALLLNILPAPIAGRLKHDTSVIADGFAEVTVLFADIVNFTTMSADADPVDVVNFLNAIFSDFDDLALKHGLEKIKTIGDAYMVAGGLPIPRTDHCEAVVAFGLDMLACLKGHTGWHNEPVHMRVGINTGPVVAGVIGRQKFIYDLWGDAVNTASRMESNGLVDVIQVTAAVRDKLAGQYAFEERPPIYIKGKGEMVTYVLRPQRDSNAP
ncbi:MAG: adenylate/guanylate cyclase domain-containing protein [Candidatus Promineofilum sp.]|nr:adenylate/guanylate cyclase domain-containing protein [Promineifilum sp.]